MNRALAITLTTAALALAGCSAKSPCALEGTWAVSGLSCADGAGGIPGPIDATYTFTGDGGRTTWRLPGCRVEAHFDAEATGERVRLRERRHLCDATAPGQGQAAFPCCEPGPVDLALSYTCSVEGEEMLWQTELSGQGQPTGPWAQRGPWRGCRAGDVGTMRLRRGPSRP